MRTHWRRTHRARFFVSTVGLGLALLAYGPKSHACCEPQQRQVWVPGRYTNATTGDVVAPFLTSSSMLAPIMSAINESYAHVVMVQDSSGTYIAHNNVDANSVGTDWTCSHPLNPYDLMPVRPGVLYQVPADGSQTYYYTRWGYVPSNFNELVAGTVLHRAGTVCALIPSYGGYLQSGGYELAGFSRNVTNGMCTEYLNNSCGVARPTPSYYSPSQISTAASNMYNTLFNMCENRIGWLASTWCGLLGTGAWGECDSVANQVINALLYWNSWDTNKENWSIAVSNVVTPARLVSGFSGAKESVAWAKGYYVTKEVWVCHPGPCY
jgi:hypothetical protein